jgi:hypothetical protein
MAKAARAAKQYQQREMRYEEDMEQAGRQLDRDEP